MCHCVIKIIFVFVVLSAEITDIICICLFLAVIIILSIMSVCLLLVFVCLFQVGVYYIMVLSTHRHFWF